LVKVEIEIPANVHKFLRSFGSFTGLTVKEMATEAITQIPETILADCSSTTSVSTDQPKKQYGLDC
jgi:hypothetical protein